MTSRGALNFWILQSQSMFSSTDKSRSYWIVMGYRWLKKTKGFLINLENRALKQDQQYSKQIFQRAAVTLRFEAQVAPCSGLSCGAGSRACRLRGRGSQASLFWGTWSPPGSGTEPMSPAWADGVPSTTLLGMSSEDSRGGVWRSHLLD